MDGVNTPCDWTLQALNSGEANLETSALPLGTIDLVGVGGATWVADDSLEDGGDDLEHNSVTIRNGGGGHFVTSGSGSLGGVLINHPPQSLAPASTPQNPAFDEGGIRKGLQDALKNPDCANFVKEMLNAVATKGNPLYKGGDIMTLFESLLSQSQGGFTRTAPPGSAGYGNAMGLISKGDASIYLYGDANTAATQTILDTKGTLHELMHLAGSKGRYTDRAFVDAIRSNPAYANLSRVSYPGDKNYKFREQAKNPNFGGWSSYWGDVLNQKCFGGK